MDRSVTTNNSFEHLSFSEYLDKTGWKFSPFILVAQVLLVPLHIFTTDLIDTGISLSPLSIWLRLVVSLLFIVCYFTIKYSKIEIKIYFGISFFLNAIGDIYLASVTSEEFLVTHLLGLSIVFIAYAVLAVWSILIYHITLVLCLLSIFVLFYLNSDIPLLLFMKEGGAFLIFLTVISSMFQSMRYKAAKSSFYKSDKIREKNEQLKQNVEELAASQESLQKQKSNLEETLKKLNTTQEQLIKSERMASVGKMTDGIAHEINNPLNFVSGGVQGLNASIPELSLAIKICRDLKLEEGVIQERKVVEMLEELKEGGDLDELIEDVQYLFEDIVSGVERISSVVKGLQLFTQIEEKEQAEESLHEIIDLALISIKKKDQIAIKKEFDDRVHPMMCYPAQLSQAISNILSNAIDAIPNKGEILIQTQQEEKLVRISITDNGMGMSEETLLKVFEPFFTQKDVGQGIGLGLSVAHGIIEKHLGNIEINSTLGEGTQVLIMLPTDAS